ncbi:MAG TPA: hypothetical protein VG960_05785 [Caulobacteraceae bacterium]|nr:hypothetical protein [Caulobacteraceae bacterium]
MANDHFGRAAAIGLSVLAAIAIPAWQNIAHVGLSAAQFSAQGDQTLRAAPYAFAIWSVIYIGLVAFAIYQFRSGVRRSVLMSRVGWPAAAGISGCGLWIIASAFNLQWLSVAVIVASTASLVGGLLAAPRTLSRAERLWIIAPLTLLAGWLTIASGLNLVTVLTAQGWITPSVVWAAGAILLVLVVGGLVARRLVASVYLAPIIWGLAGVAVAESGQIVVAGLAVAAAVALAVEAVVVGRKGAVG